MKMSKQQKDVANNTSSRSEAQRWRTTDDAKTTWVRGASAVETFLHQAAIEHNKEYNVHLPTVIELGQDISDEELRARVTAAWSRLFLEIAACSTTYRTPARYKPMIIDKPSQRKRAPLLAKGSTNSESAAQSTTLFGYILSPLTWLQRRLSDAFAALMCSSLASSIIVKMMVKKALANCHREGVTAHYKSDATREEYEQWLADTLRFGGNTGIGQNKEECRTEDAIVGTHELTSKLIEEGIPQNCSGSVRLDVVRLHARYLGLGFRFHHGIFDGTAAYVLLDEFLKRLSSTTSEAAHSLAFPAKKAEPEPYTAEKIDAWVYDGDYSSNLRAYMGQSLEVTFSNPTVSPHKVTYAGQAHQALYKFSLKETEELLAASKAQGLTVSQVAAVCHLIPLLKRRPPRDATRDKVHYFTTANVRKSLGLGDRYIGNAFLMPGISVPASTVASEMTPEIRRHIFEQARLGTDALNAQRKNGPWLVSFMDYTLSTLLGNDMTTLPENGVTSISSDGLLERYYQKQYAGARENGLSFDVHHALIQMSIQSPLLTARTATFRGQLLLANDFNDEAWAPEDAQKVVTEWADALRATLLPNETFKVSE